MAKAGYRAIGELQRQDRFGALVAIEPGRHQAVETAAVIGGRQRQVEVVDPQEPAISALALLDPARVASRKIGRLARLDRGLRLISVDESVLKWTDHRKRGWVPKLRRNQVTSAASLDSVNLIAAMCSTGEVCYTANCGITNSETFSLFLVKLVEHLDGLEFRWRERSVLILDNASYHPCPPTLRVLEQLRVPVLFLGPYHFRL